MNSPVYSYSRQLRGSGALFRIVGVFCTLLFGLTVASAASVPITVKVTPTSTTLKTGESVQLTAVVSGTRNTAVTWRLRESRGGTVSSTGLYTAPAIAGTFHVVAFSRANGAKRAECTITVQKGTTNPAIAINITPSTPTLVVGGQQTFSAAVTGSSNTSVSWSIQQGAAGGSISSSGVYTAPVTAGTYHVTARSNADATKSATATVVVTRPSTSPLKPAPAVKIFRDDRVATLEMDYNAENPWGQWWTQSGSGKEDAGFLVTWWPEGTSSAAMSAMGGCGGCNGACGLPTDAAQLSRCLVTGNRRVQLQPLVNGGVYRVRVQRINSLGEVTSEKAEFVFEGGDSSRVDALRSTLTYFDDFNRPMGPADEKLWNNAASATTNPRLNLFFINDQFHVHSLNGTRLDHTGDRSQTAQRFRKPIAIENGVRRRIVFDMDSPLGHRAVWYLDLNSVATELTGHTDFFDSDGAKGLPAGVLRLRSQFQTFSVSLVGRDGVSHPIASADMEALGRQSIPNVRRFFDVHVGTDGIDVSIDGKKIIDAKFPAGAFLAGNYDLLWNAFGYNTPKDNNPYYLIHWDNFGFDGPVRDSRVVHNYVTRIAGSDYQKSQRWNSSFPSFSVKVPDDLRPVMDGVSAEAWLIYTYQMNDYSSLSVLPGDYVQVNGGAKLLLPQPVNNSSPQDPSLLQWGMAHTVRVKLGDLRKGSTSPLLVGENSFKFFVENAGILNVHVEVMYPAGSQPAYTEPAAIHPFPMHGDLGPLGPSAVIQNVAGQNIGGFDVDNPARAVTVRGVVPVTATVGNEAYADWAPDLMVHPVRSPEIWATGGTEGVQKVELFLRRAGGPVPGDRVALVETFRDGAAPHGRYRMDFDTRSLPNGDYFLFVQATTPSGVKSHPLYSGAADRYAFDKLSGAYYPVAIKIQN